MPKPVPIPSASTRAVLYLRQSVSRDDSISLELQETAGREYCARQGYEVVAVEPDPGLSGRRWDNRPAVQRTMQMIEAKEAEVIVLWKWSRLSRNRKDWALAADRVDIAGGRIESATEPIDTATASGRFARGVMTEYAAFQSEQIGEQWQEVFERRVRLGLPPTGAMPWGWEKSESGPTISDENAAIVRTMYRLYEEGSGLVAIAKWMNARGLKSSRGNSWQFAAVRACLESPFHAGYIVYRGARHQGTHKPIISPEQYERFMDGRKERRIEKRPRVSPYLLSTICLCYCGKKRVGNVSSKRNRSYACINVEHHERRYRTCAPVDALVGEWVTSLNVEAEITQVSKPVDTRILRDRAARLRNGITALNVDHAMGNISSTERDSARAAMQTEIADLDSQIEISARAERNSPAAYLGDKDELIALWPVMTVEERQPLLRSLVEWVRIMPDDSIEIKPRWTQEVVAMGAGVRS